MVSFEQKELVVVKLNPYVGSDIHRCEEEALSLLDKLSAIGVKSRIEFHFNGKDIVVDRKSRRGDCWKQLVSNSLALFESLKWFSIDEDYDDLFSVGLSYPIISYHKTMVKVFNNRGKEMLVSVGESIYGENYLR